MDAAVRKNPYYLVLINRLLILLIIFQLAAMSAFPALEDFWQNMGTCNVGLCGLLVTIFTHWSITYIAYGGVAAVIAKEWFITGGVSRRIVLNLAVFVATLAILSIFFFLFYLPLTQATPV